MTEQILTLEKSKQFVSFPEMILIFNDWYAITEVDYEALEYLVNHSGRILLPNVKKLTDKEIELLKGYKGELKIGVEIK